MKKISLLLIVSVLITLCLVVIMRNMTQKKLASVEQIKAKEEIAQTDILLDSKPNNLKKVQDPVVDSMQSRGKEFADQEEVVDLMNYFMEIDPGTTNDLKGFIDDPTCMPSFIYSNFLVLASNWTVRSKIPLSTTPQQWGTTNLHGSRGIPTQRFIPSQILKRYEDDAVAAEEFKKNLKEREKSYPDFEPKDQMISLAQAIEVAKKECPVSFDDSQLPRVNLIRDFYLIFLWEHRRPYHSGTYHVASITIDAYSGEVRSVQVREDLQESLPTD